VAFFVFIFSEGIQLYFHNKGIRFDLFVNNWLLRFFVKTCSKAKNLILNSLTLVTPNKHSTQAAQSGSTKKLKRPLRRKTTAKRGGLNEWGFCKIQLKGKLPLKLLQLW